jgi:hypothetical protein
LAVLVLYLVVTRINASSFLRVHVGGGIHRENEVVSLPAVTAKQVSRQKCGAKPGVWQPPPVKKITPGLCGEDFTSAWQLQDAHFCKFGKTRFDDWATKVLSEGSHATERFSAAALGPHDTIKEP